MTVLKMQLDMTIKSLTSAPTVGDSSADGDNHPKKLGTIGTLITVWATKTVDVVRGKLPVDEDFLFIGSREPCAVIAGPRVNDRNSLNFILFLILFIQSFGGYRW
jgi:hypothetical protein